MGVRPKFTNLTFIFLLDTSSSRPTQESTQQSTQATPPTPELEWHEFTLPPLWKRVVAEIIDFFILFILKLVITFVAVDWFSLVDLDRLVLILNW